MATLPSGLPEVVSDSEDLSRFLTQSSHFNLVMSRPAAFLPNPKYRNASVFRCGIDPERLRQIWQETTDGQRSLKAAAVFKAIEVTNVGLSVTDADSVTELAKLYLFSADALSYRRLVTTGFSEGDSDGSIARLLPHSAGSFLRASSMRQEKDSARPFVS